jgi:hypothetical protein
VTGVLSSMPQDLSEEKPGQHRANRTDGDRPEMTNDQLAERALQVVDSHPPRTPERRAAAAAYVALADTRIPDAARRILGTFGTPQTQADARRLLDELLRGETNAA